MRKQQTMALCIVLLLLASCILTACFTPSECKNLCATCGKCTDADCKVEMCNDKCTCHQCDVCGACVKQDCMQTICATKCQCEPLQITRTSHTMSSTSGTQYNTPYYIYTTNRVGPKIVIVGGIHGDETAGWKQAGNLKTLLDNAMNGDIDPMLKRICGTILVMPKANITGCDALTRAIQGGSSSRSGDKYNLNRAFPTGCYSEATAVAKNLANAVCNVVDTFMETPNEGYTGPNIIIDLHESRGSWKKPVGSAKLGYTLIYNNNPWVENNSVSGLFMEELLYHYNDNYRPASETQFKSEPANVDGSFSKHFSTMYPTDVVFTIETDRQYLSGANTVAESTRIRQQKDVLTAMFDLVWDRL